MTSEASSAPDPDPAPFRSVVALMLVATAGCVSLLAAACTVLVFMLESSVPVIGLALPMIGVYIFALGWWIIAALLVVGVLLGIRSSDRRPQLVWTIIAGAAFVIAAGLLATVGMFPSPFG